MLEVGSNKQGQIILYINNQIKIKNSSFKSGHLVRIEVAPVGLSPAPREVRILYLDRSEIGWWQTKNLRFELLATVDPIPSGFPRYLRFKVYFYDSKNREVYTEQIDAKMVPPPSQLAP